MICSVHAAIWCLLSAIFLPNFLPKIFNTFLFSMLHASTISLFLIVIIIFGNWNENYDVPCYAVVKNTTANF
jgi:hypothetical protein